MLNKLSYILTLTTVRLVSPTNSLSSGRVEVFYNGTWETICDDSWDLQDADVVCRQLGYNGALSAPRAAAFEQGTGPIWLDDVGCFGNEKSVLQCRHQGWGVENCGHSKDAGVVCRPKGRVTTEYVLLPSLASIKMDQSEYEETVAYSTIIRLNHPSRYLIPTNR